MQLHKFKVGQRLVYSPSPIEHQQGTGLFEITRLLPSDGLEFQYRVKHASTGQERVVRESQLQRP